jgi:hypothetical protein
MGERPMRRILTSVVLLVLLLPSLAFNAFAKNERYKDDDWNTTFYDNCGMPTGDSVRWIEEENNKFIRFQLEDKDYGNCGSGSDRRARHGAPYWERAELSQDSYLDNNSSYEINFKFRLVKGFKTKKETIFQIHGYSGKSCPKPILMLKFTGGGKRKFLRLELLKFPKNRKDTRINLINKRSWIKHKLKKNDEKIRSQDILGKWINLKFLIKFNQINGYVDVFFNDAKIAKQLDFDMLPCFTPHIKFGIYRPGNKNGNKLSIIDFDKINVKKIE